MTEREDELEIMRETDRELQELLDHELHETSPDGMEWWCLRIESSPVLECFLKLMRRIWCCLKKRQRLLHSSPFSQKQYDEYTQSEDTIRTTILVLEIILRQDDPDLIELGFDTFEKLVGSMFRSMFRVENGEKIMTTFDQFRKCRGYMVMTRYRGRHQMSMTVWERRMRSGSEETAVQEHALIVRNPFLARQQRVSNLAVRLHSFAASAIAKPFVVCSPFPRMEQILEREIAKGQISKAVALSQINDECVAYGSVICLVNDAKLGSLWRLDGRAQKRGQNVHDKN